MTTKSLRMIIPTSTARDAQPSATAFSKKLREMKISMKLSDMKSSEGSRKVSQMLLISSLDRASSPKIGKVVRGSYLTHMLLSLR
jgi:hypothetical protein